MALGTQPYSEWRFSVAQPHNDFLKSQLQLESFRVDFRSLLNEIKLAHGQDAEIHVFPAVPVSVAIEIGRVRQPKADLPFIIYDQNTRAGGFVRTITIGGIKNG
jgi:hypothetical protein